MGRQKRDTSKFIELSKKVHGNKWDYSKTAYTGSLSNVIIICPNHGDFSQLANNHLRGAGCPVCAAEDKKITFKAFQQKAKRRNPCTDYEKTVWCGYSQKAVFCCTSHGAYEQQPRLNLEYGCPHCESTKRKDKEALNFFRLAKRKHKNKYVYADCVYVNSRTKIEFSCHEHGVFEQLPYNHLHSDGCPACSFSDKARYAKKSVRVGNKTFQLQGYEPQALNWLLTKTAANKIYVGKDVPVVHYTDKGKKCRHYPDFWLPHLNALVEVKSTWTLFGTEIFWKKIKLKYKAAVKAGYEYRLLLFSMQGQRLILPKAWWLMSRKQIKSNFIDVR